MLLMVTGPAAKLLALMSISCRFRLMIWVRNGKPRMLTDGLIAESADLIWLAIWLSATATATRSPMTSRISKTRTENRAMIQRRLRRLGFTRPAGAAGWGP